MLSAFRFDAKQSERVAAWEGAVGHLHSGQLLWLALRDPSDEEVASVVDALALGEELVPLLREPPRRASVTDHGDCLYLTLVAVAREEDNPAPISVECVLGANWVVTSPTPKSNPGRNSMFLPKNGPNAACAPNSISSGSRATPPKTPI